MSALHPSEKIHQATQLPVQERRGRVSVDCDGLEDRIRSSPHSRGEKRR